MEANGYDARVDEITYHSEDIDCIWFAPCDENDPDAQCDPITTQDKRQDIPCLSLSI